MRLCCSDTPLWDLVGQLPLVIDNVKIAGLGSNGRGQRE